MTLRGDRMYEFLDRLITIALPQVLLQIRSRYRMALKFFWLQARASRCP